MIKFSFIIVKINIKCKKYKCKKVTVRLVPSHSEAHGSSVILCLTNDSHIPYRIVLFINSNFIKFSNFLYLAYKPNLLNIKRLFLKSNSL